MSALARRKGRDWQAALAKHWRDAALFPEARSTQGEQTERARGRVLKRPPDIEGTPFWVEAKHQRAPNPVGALRQAEMERRKAGDDRPCIAVVRPNGDRLVGPIVVMRLETFEELVCLAVGSECPCRSGLNAIGPHLSTCHWADPNYDPDPFDVDKNHQVGT